VSDNGSGCAAEKSRTVASDSGLKPLTTPAACIQQSNGTYTVNRYRQIDLTVSDKVVRGRNIGTVADTDNSIWHCPDHGGSSRTTSYFFKGKTRKTGTPETTREQSTSLPLYYVLRL
jgi:hypothetical protein